MPRGNALRRALALTALWLAAASGRAADPPVIVEVDTSEAPALAKWGADAKALIREWHPRIVNLLPTPGVIPPRTVRLKIAKSDQGVAATSGNTITVSSGWIEKHPEDIGLVVHELVHVIQGYPDPQPSWVTEGVADYIRWVVYEAKPQQWFPRPSRRDGYTQGYQVAAGFLLWLEAEVSPGVVNKLNKAMRRSRYSADWFQHETGRSLDDLWQEYVKQR